jgi:hypothetical protein
MLEKCIIEMIKHVSMNTKYKYGFIYVKSFTQYINNILIVLWN